MEKSEDMNETDEVKSRLEEDSVLSESGFEELACKYNIYIYYFSNKTERPVCLSLHLNFVERLRIID